MYNLIDLFAGAGGLSLGFQQTRKYNIRVAFESNPTMQATYRRNHPGVDVRGDVCGADYTEIQEKYGPIDVVIGGPPCQGFSNANRQKNQAISHNNSLVKEYIRAIFELKPKAFVMENVSMLRSDVHRFYLTEKEMALVESGLIKTKTTVLPLLNSGLVFNGIIDIIKDIDMIRMFLWPSTDYLELNVIYKAAKNPGKLLVALKKHKDKLLKIAVVHINKDAVNPIQEADKTAFVAVRDYFNGNLQAEKLQSIIEAAIMYQRMLGFAMEIFTNELVVDNYSTKNGLNAEIRSFAVFDYLKAMLGIGDGKEGYEITSDVLNAAEFGVPQKRMRFVVMGIRKDIASSVKLPTGRFREGKYSTVHDAISDLEDIQPVYDVSKDAGIPMEELNDISPLAKSLRDAPLLKNHIITKTTDIAMERFEALKQGENFHALDDRLKTNTYTDVSRTQNTIYLRLKYTEPSGTVVNVRKSMWVHPTKNRAVSVREAARLQTFPDSFVFMGTKDKQYQQVGNAVPPIMAKAIAKKLASQLKKFGEE